MINIKHWPQPYSENRYKVDGENIQELIEYMIPRIRQKSQEFYRKEMDFDLKNKGICLVDAHAGMGNSYVVHLEDLIIKDISENIFFASDK